MKVWLLVIKLKKSKGFFLSRNEFFFAGKFFVHMLYWYSDFFILFLKESIFFSYCITFKFSFFVCLTKLTILSFYILYLHCYFIGDKILKLVIFLLKLFYYIFISSFLLNPIYLELLILGLFNLKIKDQILHDHRCMLLFGHVFMFKILNLNLKINIINSIKIMTIITVCPPLLKIYL